MKLILLRHDERNMLDPRFFTPLTEKGMNHRFDLVEPLSKQNIDVIYSSPFLRTIETVLPTAKFIQKPIQLEYGLYEYLHNPTFAIDWYHTPDELYQKYPYLKKFINQEYQTIVGKDDFYVLEDEEDLERRIIKMMNVLINRHKNDTILLVTHQGVINKIKDLYITPTSMKTHFPMGHFEIYYI